MAELPVILLCWWFGWWRCGGR